MGTIFLSQLGHALDHPPPFNTKVKEKVKL
jgi:hypothetical protein